jgi:uncharacterized MAPEG superfamily protein
MHFDFKSHFLNCPCYEKANIPVLSIFAAFLLIFVSKLPVSVAQALTPKGLNNNNPRKQQQELRGWGARAVAAHYNTIEAFPPFAVAVLVAQQANVNAELLANLCILFILSRLAYQVFYLINIGILRSLVWIIGWATIFNLFYLSIHPTFENNIRNFGKLQFGYLSLKSEL